MSREASDIPNVGSETDRAKLAWSEKALSEIDFKSREDMNKSREADTAKSYLPALRIDSSYTSETPGDITIKFGSHTIKATKDIEGLSKVDTGKEVWTRKADGTWGSADGKTADKVEIRGMPDNPEVVVRQEDKISVTRKDGSKSEETDGPNGSEHIVIRNCAGKITQVVHNGRSFAIDEAGRVKDRPGATVNADGEVTIGKVTLKKDGTSEAKDGPYTTIGFGDGSRIYKKDDKIIALRDAERNKIVIGDDGTARVTKGKDEVATHPLHGKKVDVLPNTPGTLVDKDNPDQRFYLDGRQTTLESGLWPIKLADAKGNKVDIEYKPGTIEIVKVKAGPYGNVEAPPATGVSVNGDKGQITYTLEGKQVKIDLVERSKRTSEGTTETKQYVDRNHTETRKGGLLTDIGYGDMKWKIDSAPNGKITKAESGELKFEKGKAGCQDIEIKDGKICVKTRDCTHVFKPGAPPTAEVLFTATATKPPQKMDIRLDREGRPTEIKDGSKANEGRGNTYNIRREVDGRIAEVTVNGRKLEVPGYAITNVGIDSRGKIIASLKDGAGKEGAITIDSQKAIKTTELPGKKVVETATSRVEYATGSDGKPMSARIFNAGATKPSFDVSFDAAGKVAAVATERGIVRARPPAVSMTLDESGTVKLVARDRSGAVRMENSLHPDRSRHTKIGDVTKSYSPEGVLTKISQPGRPNAIYEYHSEGRGPAMAAKRTDFPAEMRGKDMAVASKVNFRNGISIERVAADDLSRAEPGKPFFRLIGRDGREFAAVEQAYVDREGNTYVKMKNWHKITPNGKWEPMRRR